MKVHKYWLSQYLAGAPQLRGKGCGNEEKSAGQGGGEGETGISGLSPCLCEGARDAPPGSINPLNPRRRKRRVVGWDYCGQLPNIFSPSGISVHISFFNKQNLMP